MFFFFLYGDHRELTVLTHPFPTRRSSDLPAEVEAAHAVICRAQPVQRIDRIGIEPQGLAKTVQRKRGIAFGKLSLAPRIVIARNSRGRVGGLAAPPDIGGHLRAAAPCDRDRPHENRQYSPRHSTGPRE